MELGSERIVPTPKIVNCPQCGLPVEWTPENRYRPFCSKRCKLIDLGQWAAESYRVPVEPRDADTEPDPTE
ncbi:MAG: DNA gyrase inhibitor YacG [Betaproteobacteria bacterium RIFCSPLOWO2_12_FULL_63_13]|nr:MAG: DNA gyrase inhibitor YacG [Betaproteobacteria bacterium RIFCSPLOWO2_02_FULL_63_19]OGA53488.1 MAG: DNA gyrase inhibitor YacG [Betaproteobacteria bacterium RIFCSPLOWO2_12_FULL_63_13]